MKLTILLTGILLSTFAQAESLNLKVKNLGGESGQLAIAVFSDPDAFPNVAKSAIHTQFVSLSAGTTEIDVNLNLSPGNYAIATYLDKNKNRQLDTNMVGAPKERFGFSQNPKIGFSAPNFQECSFDVNPGQKKNLDIRLIKLF